MSASSFSSSLITLLLGLYKDRNAEWKISGALINIVGQGLAFGWKWEREFFEWTFL